MKRSATKYLAIFCILLLGRGINSQQPELSGSGDNEAIKDTYSADVLESQTNIAANRDETTAGTSERPSDIADTTPSIQNSGDDLPTTNSQEDKTNAVTETPGASQETQTPASEDAETVPAIDENLSTATTTAVSDTSKDTTEVIGHTIEPSAITEAATEPNIPTCASAGTFPSDTDCHAYSTCSPTTAGDLESTVQLCPPKMAFNVEVSRCTRDISACNDDGIVCTTAGTLADSHNNASYYWCVPRRPVGSFRKYHIDCEAGKVYVPQLEKCFVDINNLQNLPPNYGKDDDLPDDEDIVKAELKQFKAEEKLKLKEQKLKDKLEKKLQKELAKKAAKDAKEQAKLKTNSEEEN